MKNIVSIILLVLLGFITLISTTVLCAQENIKPVEVETGAPVILMDETLFYVYDRIGPFSPKDRADGITRRLTKVLKDPFAKIDEIIASQGETTTDILIGDQVLMTITDGDAKSTGKTRQELAEEYAQKIRDFLEKTSKHTSTKSVIIAIVLSLAVTGTLVTILSLLRSGFRILYVKIRSWRGKYIRPLKIHDFEILTVERIADILSGLTRVIHFAIIILLIYLYFPFVLNLYPWTKGFAGKLLGYVLSAGGSLWQIILSYLPNLLIIAVTIFITIYVIKIVRAIFSEIEKGSIRPARFHTDWAQPTFKLTRVLIIILAAVIIYQYIPGSDSLAFKGAVIFFGVVLALGSISTMSNVVAGIIITYMRAFNVGDQVRIGDTVGNIVDKSILVTRIRTNKNVEVTVPNSMILKTHVMNYSSSVNQGNNLILHTKINISYNVPWRKVHELLINAALSTRHVLKEPQPFVLQNSLDNFCASYELNAYTDEPNIMVQTYSDLHQNIQDKFNEANIEITSTSYISIRDSDQITSQKEYLPESDKTHTSEITSDENKPTLK